MASLTLTLADPAVVTDYVAVSPPPPVVTEVDPSDGSVGVFFIKPAGAYGVQFIAVRPQSAADTATVADSVTPVLTKQVGLTDAVSLADSTTKTQSHCEADLMVVGDSQVVSRAVSQSAGDSLGVADRSVESPPPPSTTGVTPSESALSVAFTKPSTADGVEYRATAWFPMQTRVDDPLAIRDDYGSAVSKVLPNDPLTLVDQLSLGFSRPAQDALTVADTASKAASSIQSEAVGTADSMFKSQSHCEADLMVVGDALSKGLSPKLLDVLGVIDALVGRDVMVCISTDEIDVQDLADTALSVTLPLDDVTDLVDSLVKAGMVSSADQVAVVDSSSKDVSSIRTDAVGVADQWARGYSALVLDSLPILDTIDFIQRTIEVLVAHTTHRPYHIVVMNARRTE